MDSHGPERAGSGQGRWFALFSIVVLLSAAGYIAWRAGSPDVDTPSGTSEPAPQPVALDEIRSAPHIYYRSTRRGEYGKLVVAALGAPNDRRFVTDLDCERLTAGHDRGVCLVDNRMRVQPPAIARLLNHDLTPVHALDLPGYPSRTRLSRDERYAATTVFVSGESYTGVFTTRTHIIDLESGVTVAELEQFATRRAGAVISAVDFNFWGVTFTDDHNRFYATLATAGKTYLVDGDLARRQFTVLRENVECPSLSPDGRRLAFKSRLNDGINWRLHVLDLASMTEWAVAGETRSIDDQVEWLDNEHVLYQFMNERGLPEDAVNTWISPVAPQAAEAPKIFIHAASSPAVVR